MSIVWPVSLPDYPLVRGYEETTPNLVVRTEMDEGPAKVRRWGTATVRNIKVSFILTKAQVATFDAFFVTSLKGGAERFTMKHPRTQVDVEMRITQPPTYSAVKDDIYTVSVALEIMP